MTRPSQLANGMIWTLAAAAVIAGVPSLWAQDSCCFTNRRFTGVCTVTPEPGQSCSGILSYLNNLSAVGKTYCGSTDIRMGWSATSCLAATASDAGVYGSPRTHRPRGPQVNPGLQPYGTTGATGATQAMGDQQPQVIDPGAAPVVIPSGMVLQVTVDQPPGSAAWGQPVTASLAEDLVADGTVVAPAGSSLRAWVSQPDPAVASAATDLVLELDSVTIDGKEHSLVAEGAGGAALGVSLPIEAGDGEVALGPATPLLPADGTVPLTAESLAGYRQAIVAANLQLSELESINFWPLYREYRQAVDAVNTSRFQLIQDFAASYETLTGDRAVAMLEHSMEIEERHLALKQAWLPRFREILPDNKVVRFFQIENKLETVVRSRLAEAVPLVR